MGRKAILARLQRPPLGEQPHPQPERPGVGQHAGIGELSGDGVDPGAARDDEGQLFGKRTGAGEALPTPAGRARAGGPDEEDQQQEADEGPEHAFARAPH